MRDLIVDWAKAALIAIVTCTTIVAVFAIVNVLLGRI
jgi:hypothetical protein